PRGGGRREGDPRGRPPTWRPPGRPTARPPSRRTDRGGPRSGDRHSGEGRPCAPPQVRHAACPEGPNTGVIGGPGNRHGPPIAARRHAADVRSASPTPPWFRSRRPVLTLLLLRRLAVTPLPRP